MLVAYSLIWLARILRNAGLEVIETDGWKERGHGEMGAVYGVLCHQTAGEQSSPMSSLNVLVRGRTDLSGPLAQLGLSRDGCYFVIAAGLCNHAGFGIWKGVTNGNAHFIGIEAENSGRPTDPWTDGQLDAYRKGTAAILNHLRRGSEWCVGHREFALPHGRKDDPNFDMDAFRIAVASLLTVREERQGSAPLESNELADFERPTLRLSDRHPAVRDLQTALGQQDVDGVFGLSTRSAVLQFQKANGLIADGLVGPQTWHALSRRKWA